MPCPAMKATMSSLSEMRLSGCMYIKHLLSQKRREDACVGMGVEGGRELKGVFKDAIKRAGLKGSVRANEAGCLDQCEHGPTVVVYPEAIWYGHVSVSDVGEIVQSHIVDNRPVERLR